MVRVEAKVNGEQVDVHTEADGILENVLEESTAILEGLYENIAKTDKGARILFLTVIGDLITEWMDKTLEEELGKGGDLYA